MRVGGQQILTNTHSHKTQIGKQAQRGTWAHVGSAVRKWEHRAELPRGSIQIKGRAQGNFLARLMTGASTMGRELLGRYRQEREKLFHQRTADEQSPGAVEGEEGLLVAWSGRLSWTSKLGVCSQDAGLPPTGRQMSL